MFVLPPPPRFPSSQYGLGMPGQPVIETNNVLSHPTGPEHQLVVGEGKTPLKHMRRDAYSSFNHDRYLHPQGQPSPRDSASPPF